MIPKKNYRVIVVRFLLGILITLLVACGNEVSFTPTVTRPPSLVITTQGPFNVTITVSPNNQMATPRPLKTFDPTQEARRAVYQTKTAESRRNQEVWEDRLTKVAQFPELDPITCNIDNPNAMVNSSEISPDGNWIATDCYENQTLIVQNQEGVMRVLGFKDFLSPDSPEGMTGGLYPKFWSPDGEYLYFVSGLGYSGGGNECFPRYSRGDYGLFRLSLKTGSWSTLIPPTDSFPGHEIKFSPTGRRFAATLNGIMVTDLNTGEVSKFDVHGVVQRMSWSPDGTHLAYSAASCGEEFLQSSSVYVWDALTNQSQTLFSTDGILLRPESWSDNSTLRVVGEEFISPDTLYTIYEYDISQKKFGVHWNDYAFAMTIASLKTLRGHPFTNNCKSKIVSPKS